MRRAPFFDVLADELVRSLPAGRRLVGVDGVDGSGKTTFTGELASAIGPLRPVIVIHADDFLQPRRLRHARGRHSPLGFWLDSYDLAALEEDVLTPLGHDGDGRYRASRFDASKDQPTDAQHHRAAPDVVTLVEGLFLHRGELRGWWDASIFLDVPFSTSAQRLHGRDGSSPDPQDPSMRRYVGGQRLYFADSRPWELATHVVDNSESAPMLIVPGETSASRAV